MKAISITLQNLSIQGRSLQGSMPWLQWEITLACSHAAVQVLSTLHVSAELGQFLLLTPEETHAPRLCVVRWVATPSYMGRSPQRLAIGGRARPRTLTPIARNGLGIVQGQWLNAVLHRLWGSRRHDWALRPHAWRCWGGLLKRSLLTPSRFWENRWASQMG